VVVAADGPAERRVIDLRRRDGAPVLKIGHRGAASLAPENTLRAFRAAVSLGVDLVEFDVLDLPRGPLVVAHSDRLDEVSHGAASGSVRALTLEELREVAPELPTLDDALAYFADEAPAVGLHVDLKLTTRLDELCTALARFDLAHRAVVSSFHAPSLRAVARDAPGAVVAFTFPEDKLGVGHRPALQPLVGGSLSVVRRVVPRLLPRMVARAGAGALMLQHRLATPASVARMRARGIPVLAWTVDEPDELERLAAAGVDGVITNDPRIFA
jgi:glycerophosphoryl diester phosphodiesterase